MKDFMNTAKFFLMSASPTFKERYHANLTELEKDYMIDEESKKEIQRLDLDALSTMLLDEGKLSALGGGDVARHTENSHTQHNKEAHEKSSHQDDRNDLHNLDWVRLMEKYGEIRNEKDFINSVIVRHIGRGQ